jgi:hypothetical protein
MAKRRQVNDDKRDESGSQAPHRDNFGGGPRGGFRGGFRGGRGAGPYDRPQFRGQQQQVRLDEPIFSWRHFLCILKNIFLSFVSRHLYVRLI